MLDTTTTMDGQAIYDLLQSACKALEQADEHAIAAHLSYTMALVSERYGVGCDHFVGIDPMGM